MAIVATQSAEITLTALQWTAAGIASVMLVAGDSSFPLLLVLGMATVKPLPKRVLV